MGKTSSKSIQSFHNIILLFLFIIGLYILYKYIKNVEKETKLLHNHIIELTDKLNFFTKQESCPVVEENNKLEDIEPTTVTPDDDRESIQSEDIVNMLRKVMVVDEDEEEEDNVKIAVVEDTEEVVDNIKEDLVKKTNEELRNVLRDKKLSTKGSKQELVDRIMENA